MFINFNVYYAFSILLMYYFEGIYEEKYTNTGIQDFFLKKIYFDAEQVRDPHALHDD